MALQVANLQNMQLRGGFFEGKEVEWQGGAALSLPVVEPCGRACGPHFSDWRYSPSGELLSAATRIGDMNDPETEPHVPEWPTGSDRFADDAPMGYIHF